MKKLFAFLVSIFALTSCQPDTPSLPVADEDSSISYEVDSDEDGFGSLEGYDPFSRLAATPKGKVTFQHMSNEGEIITAQWEKITLWYYGTTEPTEGANDRFSKPKYTIIRPANNRSYTRKSMSVGWYMLQLDEGRFAKMNVTANSDALFVWNDQNTNHPLFANYHSSYGKVKFTFGRITATAKTPAVSTKAQAFLTFTSGSSSIQFWLYNDRTAGSVTKSMFWFMPAGTYAGSWYGAQLLGDSDTQTYPAKTGPITISPGKVYPNIKL